MEVLNRAARRSRRGQSGFTLIELLVVIAVLAILAAIVLFNVVGVTGRGNSAACNTDVGTIQTAVDAYINDHPGTGVTAGDMVANGDLTLLKNGGYIHTDTTACKTLSVTAFSTTTGQTVTGVSN